MTIFKFKNKCQLPLFAGACVKYNGSQIRLLLGLVTCWFVSEVPKGRLFCFMNQRIISLIFTGNRKPKPNLMLPHWLACRNELCNLVKTEGPKNKQLLTHLKHDRKNCDLHWLELAMVILVSVCNHHYPNQSRYGRKTKAFCTPTCKDTSLGFIFRCYYSKLQPARLCTEGKAKQTVSSRFSSSSFLPVVQGALSSGKMGAPHCLQQPR